MKALKIQESITKRNSDTLKFYFQEITQIRLLEPEEEYKLAVLSHQGDTIAREKLVKHNLKFVISVAKQYETGSIKLEDLINEGNLGLIMAAEKFDPSKGFKFISYAVWWIRRNIIAYIAENGQTIRIPNNKVNCNYKIKQAYNVLEQQLQYPPTYNDLVDACGNEFTEDDIKFYFDLINDDTTSLDSTVNNSFDDSTSLYNLIEDKSTLSVTHFVDKQDNDFNQNKILNCLNKKIERDVIKCLYGLDGKEILCMKTTAFLLGLSSERVRQIRDIALRKLKIHLSK